MAKKQKNGGKIINGGKNKKWRENLKWRREKNGGQNKKWWGKQKNGGFFIQILKL